MTKPKTQDYNDEDWQNLQQVSGKRQTGERLGRLCGWLASAAAVAFFVFLCLTECICRSGIGLVPSTPTPFPLEPVGILIAQQAVKFIEFDVVDGWQMIGDDGLMYSIGSSGLKIFVFSADGDPVACVNTIVQVVSLDTVVDQATYDTTLRIAGTEPSIIAVVDGHMIDSGNPTRGLYAAFGHGPWVYLFAWDAFDEETRANLEEIAAYTLDSIRFVSQ